MDVLKKKAIAVVNSSGCRREPVFVFGQSLSSFVVLPADYFVMSVLCEAPQ